MNVQCCPFIAPWAIDKAALVQQKRSWDENLPFMQARPHLSPSPQHLPHSPPPPVPLLVPRKPLLPRNRHLSAPMPLSCQPPRVEIRLHPPAAGPMHSPPQPRWRTSTKHDLVRLYSRNSLDTPLWSHSTCMSGHTGSNYSLQESSANPAPACFPMSSFESSIQLATPPTLSLRMCSGHFWQSSCAHAPCRLNKCRPAQQSFVSGI
jgi:hypothetical protein